MAVRVAGCLLLLTALGAPLRAPAQGSKPDFAEILRSFRFVATEANGEPVTDLRPEEIQVSDEGKRHPLVYSRVLLHPAPLPERLGPREYSNRSALQSSVLILLDLLNANVTERGSAWNETLNSLEKQEAPENIFLYLITPDANLYPVRAWQPPPAPGEAPPPTGAPWTQDARTRLNDALRAVEGIKPTDLTAAPGLTVGPTYQALSNLGGQYASLPGQKRMIWVTHGVPLTVPTDQGPVDFTPQLKKLGAELSAEGVAIYTVHQQDRSGTGADSGETLQLLPPFTGGRWFENDSVGPALTQARADARGTYQAGYYVPAKEADGKFHKLRVSTTRKGVKILAQDTYVAASVQDLANERFRLVSARPFDTGDIGLRASINVQGGAAHFQIHFDPRDLALQHSGNSYTGAVSLSLLFYNADGTSPPSPSAITNLNLTQDQFDSAAKDGYLVTVDKPLPAGTRTVRIVAQDVASGTAGSLSIPVFSP